MNDAAIVEALVEYARDELRKACAGCCSGDPLDGATWRHTSQHAGPVEPWLPATYDCTAQHLHGLISHGCNLAARLRAYAQELNR